MRSTQESASEARARFWFVLVVFVLLMGLAHAGAELAAQLDARSTRTGAEGQPVPTVIFYQVRFTSWVTLLLLTPALCFHIFSRSGARNSYWRAFWTFSYLAYLVNFSWMVFGGAIDPEKGVESLGPYLVLTA